VFHNQSQKIGIINLREFLCFGLNNWPSNTPGSVKYSQPATVWS